MGSSNADDREKRIAQCVELIAQVRRARSWQDFARLSDAELIQGVADRLTANSGQRRLIACALALTFDVGRNIEPVCELLHDLGIRDVDPQALIAMRRRDMVKDFERALREFSPDGELRQMDRLRELAIKVGSIALNGRADG